MNANLLQTFKDVLIADSTLIRNLKTNDAKYVVGVTAGSDVGVGPIG